MRTILITCLSILFLGSGCIVYQPSPPIEQVNQETLRKFLKAGDRIKVRTTSDETYRLNLIALEETILLGNREGSTIKIPYKLIQNIEKGKRRKGSIAVAVIIPGLVVFLFLYII